ncbi:MAG: hypothetical protein R2703_06865 [Micropruina glycogenica]
MRLVITQNVTADGAVGMLTDWFDPSDQDQELAAELRRQDERMTCYWPEQTDDTTGVSDQLNRGDQVLRGQRSDAIRSGATVQCWRSC